MYSYDAAYGALHTGEACLPRAAVATTAAVSVAAAVAVACSIQQDMQLHTA
jgi:hypothetical protein